MTQQHSQVTSALSKMQTSTETGFREMARSQTQGTSAIVDDILQSKSTTHNTTAGHQQEAPAASTAQQPAASAAQQQQEQEPPSLERAMQKFQIPSLAEVAPISARKRDLKASLNTIFPETASGTRLLQDCCEMTHGVAHETHATRASCLTAMITKITTATYTALASLRGGRELPQEEQRQICLLAGRLQRAVAKEVAKHAAQIRWRWRQEHEVLFSLVSLLQLTAIMLSKKTIHKELARVAQQFLLVPFFPNEDGGANTAGGKLQSPADLLNWYTAQPGYVYAWVNPLTTEVYIKMPRSNHSMGCPQIDFFFIVLSL